jgi:hypothetical protein
MPTLFMVYVNMVYVNTLNAGHGTNILKEAILTHQLVMWMFFGLGSPGFVVQYVPPCCSPCSTNPIKRFSSV